MRARHVYLCAQIRHPLFILFIVFSIIATVQLVYFIVFLVAFGRGRRKVSGTNDSNGALPISIIISAHDEETHLRELIPQILQQDYPAFEVIIVDDRSNDGTFDLLLDETKRDHRLRMVHVNRTPPHVNSKKYALTLGIKAAHYEWIVVTDADCRPSSNQWLSGMATAFNEETSFVLGYSPYQKKPGFLNLFVRFESLLTAIQYLSFAWLGNPYMGVGRNMAYRRSVFLESKGFNSSLSITGGDDDLLVNQLATQKNTAVVIEPGAQVLSFPKDTWTAFFNQKIRHLSVGKHYRLSHRLLLGLFTVSWILTWFTGLPLAIFSDYRYIVLGVLIFRLLLAGWLFYDSARKLGQRFEAWAILPLDFLYAFYYLVTGLVALFTKKVRWKN
jgi:cellulose synthase/poly-beta-1,6-N-acetylglucosamine synthase-like glycosyltransferase